MSDLDTQNVNRMKISQYHNTIPFYKGDFQFLENSLNKLSNLKDDYGDFYIDDSQDEAEFLTKNNQNQENYGRLADDNTFYKNQNVSVKTYYNRKYKKRKKNIPYHGYQDPNEIDWSVYGPDRPGKRPTPDDESIFSSIASDTELISVASFFGLLLPGILGSLYFLGVPLTQVGLILRFLI